VKTYKLGIFLQPKSCDMSAELGKVIQAYREKAGWTQDELGKALGVSQQTVAKWEGGKSSPRPKAMRLLIDTLKIDGQKLKQAIPNTSLKGWEGSMFLAEIVLDDPSPLSLPESLPTAFPFEATLNRIPNSLALKKLLMPVVSQLEPSSRWDQIVRTQWGNWRVDYMNDELYAKFLHAPNTAALTTLLRTNIYRHLWKFAMFNGGRHDDSNYYLVIVTLPQDQPIDFPVDETRRFAPTVPNSQVFRRLILEANSMGIYVMLARTPQDVAGILANPAKIGDMGWEWRNDKWDGQADEHVDD
jgi:transcriptional regulator with XRE-family HTH domain